MIETYLSPACEVLQLNMESLLCMSLDLSSSGFIINNEYVEME